MPTMPTNGGVRKTGRPRVGNTMTQWSLSREIKINRVNFSSVLDLGYVRGFHGVKVDRGPLQCPRQRGATPLG